MGVQVNWNAKVPSCRRPFCTPPTQRFATQLLHYFLLCCEPSNHGNVDIAC